jgi:hypothetical protein
MTCRPKPAIANISATGVNAERLEVIERSFLTFLSEKALQAA